MSPPKKQADIPPFIQEFIKSLKAANFDTAHVPPAWAADKPRRIEELRGYANLQMQIYLNSWGDEVRDAINLAQPPSRPQSHLFWYIALARNLLWAATSLINPAAAA